jgi:hypothetical protein
MLNIFICWVRILYTIMNKSAKKKIQKLHLKNQVSERTPRKRILKYITSRLDYNILYSPLINCVQVGSLNSHNRQSNYKDWRPCLIQVPGPTGLVRVPSQGYVASRQDSLVMVGNLREGNPEYESWSSKIGSFATGW